VGLSCGHYKLDLSKHLHRLTVERILTLDNSEAMRRRMCVRGGGGGDDDDDDDEDEDDDYDGDDDDDDDAGTTSSICRSICTA
jgi:hypothetical protein